MLRILLVVAAVACVAEAGYVNKDVQRNIDLSTHTPRHSIKITAVKKGGDASEAYLVAFPSERAKHVAWIDASDEESNDLAVSPDTPASAKKDVTYYRINLGSLSNDAKKTFTINVVYTHVLHPLPRKIAQGESQRMVYEGNHFFFSPYDTENQKTEVKLASSNVEHHSEEKPTSVKGETVVYGPYNAKAPYSHSPLRVHFEHNAPFYAVTTLVKEIEVSLWGNVAVEEHYDLRHTGAELKGFFSRLDLQRNPSQNGAASIRQIKAELPPHAADVYYRDVIGNISTSTMRDGEDGPELEIVPRFPLFGGWKTQFYFGYNLPLPSYVHRDDNGRYHLNITYGSGLEDVVIDDHTVKIILPEGTSNFAVSAPFDHGKQSQETRLTYLDRIGRPVVVLHKTNVIADHDVFFQVSFDFTGVYIYHEPLLLILGFFAIFAVCIVRTRLFDSSDKSQATLAEFREIHHRRVTLRAKQEHVWHKHATGEVDAAEYREQYRAIADKLAEAASEAKSLEVAVEGGGAEVVVLLPEIRAVHREEATLDEQRAAVFATASIAKPVDEATLKRFHARAEQIDRSVNKR